MGSGRAVDEPCEVAGDAAVFVGEDEPSRASRGRSRTASASSRPGSSASRRSAGTRLRSGRSRPTGKRSDEGLRSSSRTATRASWRSRCRRSRGRSTSCSSSPTCRAASATCLRASASSRARAALLRRERERGRRGDERRVRSRLQPDAVPEAGAIETLVRFADEHPRRSRRPARFLAGRHLAAVAATLSDARHALAPDAAPSPAQAVRASDVPLRVEAEQPTRGDWLLGGACLLMRRTMLERSAAGTAATGTTSRTSISRTALPRQAGSAGSCRTRSSGHAYAAVIDKRFLSRHTLWHARGMARYLRKHGLAAVRGSYSPSPTG